MQTFSLSSGTEIPALGLGTWQLRGGTDTVQTALELGYRLIDTSGDYGTQPAIGTAIHVDHEVTGEAVRGAELVGPDLMTGRARHAVGGERCER